MQTDQDNAQLKLPTVLDLTAAEEFLATLRQHLQGESALRLDASSVETLTLPCIQILLAAMRDHGQISIEQPSSEFANAFRDLGLNWTNGDAPRPPNSSANRTRTPNRKPNRKMTQVISTMSRRMRATWPSESLQSMTPRRYATC